MINVSEKMLFRVNRNHKNFIFILVVFLAVYFYGKLKMNVMLSLSKHRVYMGNILRQAQDDNKRISLKNNRFINN